MCSDCRSPLCRPSWSLAGVVVVICSGLVLLVAGETRFDLVQLPLLAYSTGPAATK